MELELEHPGGVAAACSFTVAEQSMNDPSFSCVIALNKCHRVPASHHNTQILLLSTWR